MRRREFLRLSVGIAVAGPVVVSKAAQPQPIRIGFLGAVHSHAAAKIQIARDSAEWRLVGICEPAPQGRQIAERLSVPLLSEADLIERSQVIAIEGAVRDQSRLALRALRAGKHIHLEKPGAAILKEFEEIIAGARQRKLLVQTGYMWRHNPGLLRIQELVRNGWLGEIVMIRAHMSNNLAPASRAEWAEFKGGSMFEQGSHMIDALVRIMGQPKSIVPVLRTHGSSTDSLKDNNVVVFEYPRATAVLTNTSLQPTAGPQRSFEVLGSQGWAKLEPVEPPTLKVELKRAAGHYRQGVQDVPLPRFQRYVGDFVELAAAVRGERALSVSLDEELLVAETTLRASEML